MRARLLIIGLGILITHMAGAQSPAPEAVGLCEHCHGPGGNSRLTENPVLAAQPAPYLVRQLEAYRSGLRVHALMQEVAGNLTEDETALVAQYFATSPLTLSPALEMSAQATEGARLAERLACEGCHPPSPAPDAEVPRLRGQHEAYLAEQMHAFRDGTRSDITGGMAAAAATLRDSEIAALAAWFASAPPP